jgi:hypothetical protein
VAVVVGFDPYAESVAKIAIKSDPLSQKVLEPPIPS